MSTKISLDVRVGQPQARLRRIGSLSFQAFSTCTKSSSTGVARPKIEIRTRTLPFSGFTSSTVPLKSWKGPSTTLIASPTSNSTFLALRPKPKVLFDLDRLALLEQHLGLGPERALLHLLLDFLDLGHRHFGRIGGMPDEAGDFRRILYDVPGLVVAHHLHEDIAGEKFAAGDLARTALAEFLHALDRHQHLADLFFLVERADPLLEGGLGLVLVARVGVDDIPLHRGLGGGLCNWLSHV